MVNGWNGYVVDDFKTVSGVVDGLADAIVDALNDDEGRERMGRNGVRTIEEGGLTLKDVTRKYEMLYEELLLR